MQRFGVRVIVVRLAVVLIVLSAFVGCNATPTPYPTYMPSPTLTAIPAIMPTLTPAGPRTLSNEMALQAVLTPIPAILPEGERYLRGWLWAESGYALVATTSEAMHSLLDVKTQSEFEDLIYTLQVLPVKSGTPILFLPFGQFATIRRLEYPNDRDANFTLLDYIVSSETAKPPRSARNLADFPDSVFPFLTPIPSLDVLDETIGSRGWIFNPLKQMCLAVTDPEVWPELIDIVRGFSYYDALPYLKSKQAFAIYIGTPVLVLDADEHSAEKALLLVRILHGEDEGKIFWVLSEDVVLTVHQ